MLALLIVQRPPCASAGVGFVIEGANGAPGEIVEVTVRLSTDGEAVAGLQADIGYDRRVVAVAAKEGGRPDCSDNVAIDKGATTFAFVPAGCDPQRDCLGVRALVFALDNVRPISAGAALFRCRVAIAPNAAPGSARLSGRNALYAPPQGGDLHARVDAGAIQVEGGALTVVPTPSLTPRLTPSPTAPRGSSSGGGGGGCRVRDEGEPSLGYGVAAALLFPFLRRRRDRRAGI